MVYTKNFVKMLRDIDDQKITEQLKWNLDELKNMCDFIKSKSFNQIVSKKHFWKLFQQYCNTVLDNVCNLNYDICKEVVLEWIHLLEVIISKDYNFKKTLQKGPLNYILSELLNADKEYPNWFIKTFFNSLFVHFQFGDSALHRFFEVVWGAISYSSQEAYLHVIISNFDHDTVYKYIRKKCINKELQQLFDFILERNNDQGSIRNFLNYINMYENSRNVFSFKSLYIKLRGLLLVKNTWIDVNIKSDTITFSAKKSDLCNEEESQQFRHHSKEDYNEFHVVTVKTSHISYVSFKSGLDNNEAELSFELSQPLTTFYKSSTEFLKNFRVVSIYITDDERLKAFLLEYFSKKAEVPIKNLNPNNFELELPHSDSSNQSSIERSPTDTAQYLEIVEENNNSQDNDGELDENLIIDGSGSEYDKCKSTILHTPESRASANISVDESQPTFTDDSICSDSVSSSHEITHYKSAIFTTPVPKSTNVSVAASYDTPDNRNTQDSVTVKEENCRYNSIRVRTPEIINQLPIEIIDLISPDVVKKDNKYEQIEKRNEIENIEPVIPPPEPKEISQNPAIEPNVVKKPKTISKKRLSNVTNVSEVSEENDEETLQQNEDNLQLHNTSSASKGTQVSLESTSTRKTRKRRKKSCDDTAEFEETSFFSDRETKESIYTYTKTRVVRKYRPFQYNSDPETNPRRTKKINKQKVSEAEDTDVDVPPPVKKIKTLLPRRYSIATSTPAEGEIETSNNPAEANVNKVQRIISDVNYNSDPETNPRRTKEINKQKVSEAEDTDVDVPLPVKKIKTLLPRRYSIATSTPAEGEIETSNNPAEINVNKVKRIMSDVNSVDHLVEEPTEQVFRLSVPKNTENDGQKEEIKSRINIPKKLDNFDKMVLNIQSQQSPQKSFQFFSSSQSSPDNQTNIQNGQIQSGQNSCKSVELGSTNSHNSSQNSPAEKKSKRKTAKKYPNVVKKREYKKKTAAEKITKNKRTKKELIEEVQNGSGDHQLLRVFAETNQISFEQAFRQLMPKIESDIQNICEGWTVYATEKDKKIFRSNMKKYFS